MESSNSGGSTGDRMSMGAKLVSLNESVSKSQLDFLKVACSVLNIPRTELESQQSFVDVYRLIEERRPDDSVSLVIKILEAIGVSGNYLRYLKSEVQNEAIIEDNPMLDLILTFSRILTDLSKAKYNSLREIARRSFFDNYNPCNIASRSCLLQLMLDGTHLTVEKFDYLFAWLEVIDCQSHQQYLRDFCNRQGIVEPEWRSLIPRVEEFNKSKVDVVPQRTSDPTTHQNPILFPGVASCGSFPPTVAIGNDSRTHPHSDSRIEEHSTRDTSPDDPVTGISYPFPSTESAQSNTEVVMPQTNRSLLANTVALDMGRGGNVRSDTTPMDDVVEGDGPYPPVPITHVHNLMSPKAINESSTYPSEENLDVRRLGSSGDNKSNESWLRCILFSVLVVNILLILSFLAGGLTSYFIVINPAYSTYLIGGARDFNTIVYIDCYDPAHIRSITVAKDGPHSYHTQLYLMNQDDITLVPTVLPVDTNIKLVEPVDIRVGINYGELDTPLYTADVPAALIYNFTTIGSVSSNCPLKLYLFDDLDDYNDFRSGATPNEVNSSSCISVTENLEAYSVNFALPKRGFYFVGLAISEGVSVNFSISALLQTFNVSEIGPERCSINNGRSCVFPITGEPVPSFGEDNVCLLVETAKSYLQNVTVRMELVYWNVGSVTVLSVGCGSLVVCLVLVFALVGMRRWKLYKSRRGYDRI